MRPLGVVLAGGLATRMGGGDKALLPLGGRSLLAHALARLAPQVGAVALNANGDAARFASYGLPVLADTITGYPGPLAGVLAGLDWAASQDADAIVTVAADTPFFPTDLVAQLVAQAQGQTHPLVLAATPRRALELQCELHRRDRAVALSPGRAGRHQCQMAPEGSQPPASNRGVR